MHFFFKNNFVYGNFYLLLISKNNFNTRQTSNGTIVDVTWKCNRWNEQVSYERHFYWRHADCTALIIGINKNAFSTIGIAFGSLIIYIIRYSYIFTLMNLFWLLLIILQNPSFYTLNSKMYFLDFNCRLMKNLKLQWLTKSCLQLILILYIVVKCVIHVPYLMNDVPHIYITVSCFLVKKKKHRFVFMLATSYQWKKQSSFVLDLDHLLFLALAFSVALSVLTLVNKFPKSIIIKDFHKKILILEGKEFNMASIR